MVRHFLLILLTSNSRGEMIIESASAEKDIFLLQSFAYFLGSGIIDLKIDRKIVRDTLTSVSFVTKQNNDIEEQIADLFGYAAKLKYKKQSGEAIMKNGLYEKMILEALNRSIYKVPKEAKPKKISCSKRLTHFWYYPRQEKNRLAASRSLPGSSCGECYQNDPQKSTDLGIIILARHTPHSLY